MSEISRLLAENIKALRKRLNITQAELAEKMDVSLAVIQHYEALRRWPGIENIQLLAKSLGVEEWQLFQSAKSPTVSLTDEQSQAINAQFTQTLKNYKDALSQSILEKQDKLQNELHEMDEDFKSVVRTMGKFIIEFGKLSTLTKSIAEKIEKIEASQSKAEPKASERSRLAKRA